MRSFTREDVDEATFYLPPGRSLTRPRSGAEGAVWTACLWTPSDVVDDLVKGPTRSMIKEGWLARDWGFRSVLIDVVVKEETSNGP